VKERIADRCVLPDESIAVSQLLVKENAPEGAHSEDVFTPDISVTYN